MASRIFTILFYLFGVTATTMLPLPNANVWASERGSVVVVSSGSADNTFQVEVMRTPRERARGLMHRKSLPADQGMLFDFGEPVVARMWMKDTLIPLDMLFIRSDGIISNIARNTVPHSLDVLSSQGRVRYVLEINGGLSAALGINAGDRVSLPPF